MYLATEMIDCLQEGVGSGSMARVTSDFRACRPDEVDVRAGETVTIVRVGSRGCLVRLCSEEPASAAPPEGWLPAHVLSTQVLFYSSFFAMVRKHGLLRQNNLVGRLDT